MTEKDIREQITDIESELILENNKPELLNDAGVGYYLLGEFAESRHYLEKAVKIHKSPVYLFNLANTYSKLGQHGLAIDTYLQVLEMNPSHIGSLNNLADEYEKKGELEKAHELFHYLTHIQPDEAISHFNLGNYFLRQNQHIEASKCYEKAIQNDPEFIDAYYNIAWILYRAKVYKESEKYVMMGLKIDRTHTDLSELKRKLDQYL